MFIKCLKTALAALLLTTFTAFAQKGEDGPLRFETLSWNFGEIEESAGPVRHTFAYINLSEYEMRPEYVRPSCSCTTALYQHEAVPPGQTGEITVIYDPASLPGQFHQYVEFVTNHGKSRYRLVIDGVVKERTKEVDELFPYFVNEGLQVSSLTVRLGYAEQGVEMVKTVGIANTSKSTIKLGAKLQKAQPGITVSTPAELKPGTDGLLTITSRIPSGNYGSIDNKVIILADGKESVKNITLSGYAVDKRVESADAPSFRYTPTLVNLGSRKAGSTAKAKISVSNTGGKPLHIRRIECPAGVSISLTAGQTIQPKASMDVQMEVAVPQGNGNIKGSVRVFTDDPARPMREILYTTLIK